MPLKNTYLRLIVILVNMLLVLCTVSCSKKKEVKASVKIATDISFKSVIEQQHLVFNTDFAEKQNTYIDYITETDCFKSLLEGEADMIITSRPVNKEEKEYFIAKDSSVPHSFVLAYDAIVFLLSANISKRQYTTQEIKNILIAPPKGMQILVEGKNGSSSLLHLMRLLKISYEEVSPKIIGMESAKKILQYIKQNPNAIGIVGSQSISKIGESPMYTIKKQHLKIAYILNESINKYINPMQDKTSFNHYPFARPIYYTTLDRVNGPGIRFGRFMANEQGQLIFEKSHVLPAYMQFTKRNVLLK